MTGLGDGLGSSSAGSVAKAANLDHLNVVQVPGKCPRAATGPIA